MRQRYDEQGIRVAAISYDTVEILQNFSERVGIGFPLLADPESRIIERFGIVNVSVPRDSPHYGFAYAGYYLIDEEGVVTAKFFNEKNNDRYTSAGILIREFDQEADDRQGEADTRHFKLTWSASNAGLRPGQRAALVLDFDLKPKMHLYAPGKHRYVALEWTMNPVDGVEILEPGYPPGERVHLPAIKETVPVYDGDLRVVRDLHVLGGRQLPDELAGRDAITLSGTLRYQACDDRGCYPPAEVPLEWSFRLEPHDLTRVPDDLRRAAGD